MTSVTASASRRTEAKVKKIPTLYMRDSEDLRYVDVTRVNPVAQWVIDGEGVPTRKYDGTCMMLDKTGYWWARREVKPGKVVPPNYRPIETDPTTGKAVGWEPVHQSAFARFVVEALTNWPRTWQPGTYELIGPKVNGNPEGVTHHHLIPHDEAEVLQGVVPHPAALAVWLNHHSFEGIVWHHPDGRMAKIKRRDLIA